MHQQTIAANIMRFLTSLNEKYIRLAHYLDTYRKPELIGWLAKNFGCITLTYLSSEL